MSLVSSLYNSSLYDPRRSQQPRERLMGVDLPNGLTYIGKTTSCPGDSVVVLNDYMILDSRTLDRNISSVYEDETPRKIRNEPLRIEREKRLALREGPLLPEIKDNPAP